MEQLKKRFKSKDKTLTKEEKSSLFETYSKEHVQFKLAQSQISRWFEGFLQKPNI